jgi:hypothetical protein
VYDLVCSFKKVLCPKKKYAFCIILRSLNSHGATSQISLENRELEKGIVCCGLGVRDRVRRENVASILHYNSMLIQK